MEIKSLFKRFWTEGMDMKRNTKIKKIITGFLLYLLLIAFAVPLCACSSKNDEEEYEEEESRDKKKKKKDSDEEDKDKPDETLTEKLQSMMPGPENADEAYAEFGKTLTLIAGKSFDYSTSGVEGEYGYDYETDTKDVPMGCLGYMIADFDADGEKELLTYETVNEAAIAYSMYEYDDNEVKLSDRYEIKDSYLSGDGCYTFSFIYGYANTIRIGYYSDGWVFLTGDGEFVYFVGLTYENGKFEVTGTGGYAGSDVYEDEELLTNLKNSGIYAEWEDLDELGILRSCSGSRIYSIDVDTTDEKYKDDQYMPVYMQRRVTFGGFSSLEEVEEEYDKTAHENYIFPYSAEKYLTEEDLIGLSSEELRRGRNEIVARHGRKFSDEELQAYFDSKPWYYGYIEPEDFNTEYMLNEIEKENMEFIKKHEN